MRISRVYVCVDVGVYVCVARVTPSACASGLTHGLTTPKQQFLHWQNPVCGVLDREYLAPAAVACLSETETHLRLSIAQLCMPVHSSEGVEEAHTGTSTVAFAGPVHGRMPVCASGGADIVRQLQEAMLSLTFPPSALEVNQSTIYANLQPLAGDSCYLPVFPI
jgi:hypothetical protein